MSASFPGEGAEAEWVFVSGNFGFLKQVDMAGSCSAPLSV